MPVGTRRAVHRSGCLVLCRALPSGVHTSQVVRFRCLGQGAVPWRGRAQVAQEAIDKLLDIGSLVVEASEHGLVHMPVAHLPRTCATVPVLPSGSNDFNDPVYDLKHLHSGEAARAV